MPLVMSSNETETSEAGATFGEADGADESVTELSNRLGETNLTQDCCAAVVASQQLSSLTPVPQSLPTTITRSYSIQGVSTHTFCQIFSDRIIVGVTQLPSHHIGNWVLCQASQSPVDPKVIESDLSTLLGNHNDAMPEVFARRITDCVIRRRLIPGTNRMVILMGISLLTTSSSAENGRERFRLIVDTVVGLIEEALGITL